MKAVTDTLFLLDRLQAKIDDKDTRARERYRLPRTVARIREKIRNKVDDMQRKLVKHLVNNYDVRDQPDGHAQGHASAPHQQEGGVANAHPWRHYDFKTRLIVGLRRDRGRELHEQNLRLVRRAPHHARW